MTQILEKTETVLDLITLDEATAHFDDRHFREAWEQPDRRVRMSRETWEDFGSPLQVTVTIVPGDTLNDA